jgi:hypothetical protein
MLALKANFVLHSVKSYLNVSGVNKTLPAKGSAGVKNGFILSHLGCQ